MKKSILILGALITLNVNAQLVVKETVKDTVVWQASKLGALPKIVKFTNDGSEYYTIYYKNEKYKTLNDINYLSTSDIKTTVQFYELCQSAIMEDKEYNIKIDGKTIILQKTLGSAFIFMDGSYFTLNSNQLISILESLK